MALRLKTFINRVKSCDFKEVVDIIDNKKNFNDNLED